MNHKLHCIALFGNILNMLNKKKYMYKLNTEREANANYNAVFTDILMSFEQSNHHKGSVAYY